MEELHETQQYAAQRLGEDRRRSQQAHEGPDRRKHFTPREEDVLEEEQQKQRQDQIDRRPETD